MATVDKNFKIKNGLIVGDSTNLVNYTSASPSDPFVGQLWINEPFLYAWSSASTWVLIGDGTASGGGAVGGGSASGTPLNISNTLVARSASGTFAIGAIDFDTTASPVLSVGRMQWNQNFGTPEVGLIGGNVTANIGQHVHAYVTNDEGSSLVAGDVVYLFGATGDRASVKKAYNLSDATSSKTFGVVAETIAAGQAGFVTVFGVVNKLNLSSYNPGDVLWLSASPGKFTSIKPSAPQHLVFVGVVEKANAGNGQLFVNVQNGYELEELHSVQITNLTDNDILSYNGSSSLWFNQNLSTAIQEVDGAGSGIDADLLDAQQGSYYLDWNNTTNKPDPIVGLELTGNTTGAASVTLTDLTNGQITLTTNTSHATTASSIAGSLVSGTVANATNASHANTASSIYGLSVEGPVASANFALNSNKLNGFDESYFLNTSTNTQEKLGQVTFHDTVYIKNLVITGSSTTISSTNLALSDSLIQLAEGQHTTDAVDIGIVGSYGDITTSSASHYHASFARDASDNKWKLLSKGPAQVNNVIDYTDPSVEFGTLQIGALEVTSSAVVTNLNADLLDGYSSTYFLSAATASSTYAPLSSPALTGTPTAPTATVDNNSTQIATTAYVIGQGYLKSATASSIYIAQSSPTTGTASIVYSNHPTLIRPLLQSPQEIATISATAATASINYDVLSQTVLYYTSSAIGNWHLNVRGNSTNTLSSLLEVGELVTLVFGVDQGTTAYYQLNLMIDGTQVVPRWQGGSAPTGGNISGTDIYSYTIVKTAATPTYRVFAALTGFA